MPKNETVKIVARDIPLIPNRVASVFKQKQTAVSNESSEDDGETQIIEKIREVTFLYQITFTVPGRSKTSLYLMFNDYITLLI